MAVAPDLLAVPEGATVVSRARRTERRRRPRLPIDRTTAYRILDESIAASSIPIILGSKPLTGAKVWVHDGVIHMKRDQIQLMVDRAQNKRVIRAYNPRWCVDVECRLLRTTDGWREIYSELSEYGSVDTLLHQEDALRRQSTRVNEDESVLTISLSHAVDGEEDILRRTQCVTRRDGSRVEEQEEVALIAGRERYDLTRTEYDDNFRKVRTLNYAYPPAGPGFYKSMRERISCWPRETDWLDRTSEW